jgi:hypothetical protein
MMRFSIAAVTSLMISSLASADAPPPPVQVTYQCQGNLKVYFHRGLYDGMAQGPTGKGFTAIGYPKIENTEMAILNAHGLPEFLVHPTMSECGCLVDDAIFVTQFLPTGPRHFTVPQGGYHFELADGSGSLDCRMTLTGQTGTLVGNANSTQEECDLRQSGDSER